VSGSAATSILNLCAHRAQEPIDATPFHKWVFPDGTLWATFYRAGDHYVLRFPTLADFTVLASGTEVVVHPVPGVSAQTVEHLYLNQVLPLALSRQWKLVLHASAVEVEKTAVAFLGASGRGKSTLAASFATSGHRFLTDDGLQLEKSGEGYLVEPSHASIRLWDDSRDELIPETTRAAPSVDYTHKLRLLADDEVAFCDVARPLRCVYFLGDGGVDDISIHPASGRDAMIELVRHSFLLDIEEREMLTRHFAQLTELARRPMFARLDFPRRYEMLPSVRDAVIRHVRAGW
jgi:hypothetical protein